MYARPYVCLHCLCCRKRTETATLYTICLCDLQPVALAVSVPVCLFYHVFVFVVLWLYLPGRLCLSRCFPSSVSICCTNSALIYIYIIYVFLSVCLYSCAFSRHLFNCTLSISFDKLFIIIRHPRCHSHGHGHGHRKFIF
jgi:hypothetical protein